MWSNRITPQQAQSLISQGQLDIVDVCEPKEWSNGYVAGSRLVPLGELRRRPKALLPRDGVIFICAAGMRSQVAAKLALANGRTNVYNLTGGTQSWVKADLPLVRDASVPREASA